MMKGHRNIVDQRASIDWARHVLRKARRYVILDTETTGVKKTDEIIQITVIDLDGNALVNENIRPTKRKRIPKDATAIHELTMDMLADCPTFAELRKPLKKAIGRKRIIAHNAEFDARLYSQSYQLAGGFVPKGDWECAMLQYARFVGQWNDYYGNYRWQKLQGGDHSAVGDCLATLEVIRKMAATPRPRGWFEFWVGA